MKQFQGTFQRYEKKYRLNEEEYRRLFERLQGELLPDRFEKSTICNIYYDTPDHQLIRRSLEKPVYKEKLRLRSYGVPSVEDNVFLELKKKYRGVVYKRRIDLPLFEAEELLAHDCTGLEKSQIGREIAWTAHHYEGLSPAMYLSYDRTAYVGREDSRLRLTFDSRILWREEALRLEEGVWGTRLMPPGDRIMEVKIPGAMPLWLAHILDEEEIYPASYSKYGNAYRMAMEQKTNDGKGKVIICA